MIRISIAILILLFLGCAGGSYSSNEGDDFDASICRNIPLGVEEYQALDPSIKAQKISCADLERCAALSGQTPPDIPCE
ncbi:MAG: hypothetical protein ACRENZ_05845 [Thermodesulfobacteriota bacterium]